MDDIEYVKSNKGGPKIIHKGYMYTVHKNKKGGGIRWRCAQRSLNCKGSISTDQFGIPFLNMPHNHLPDTYSVAMARSKILCDSGNMNLHSIFDILLKQSNTGKLLLKLPKFVLQNYNYDYNTTYGFGTTGSSI